MGLREFFFGPQQTVETACDKASRLDGWSVEQTETGYAVHGTAGDGQPSTWQYGAGEVGHMNDLLDHAGSCRLGDEYRQQRFGLKPGEVDVSPGWVEHKHEIREHRMSYYEQEYKSGWKKLLGL